MIGWLSDVTFLQVSIVGYNPHCDVIFYIFATWSFLILNFVFNILSYFMYLSLSLDVEF